MDKEIRNYENNQELSVDQLDNVIGGFSIGDVVTIGCGVSIARAAANC